MKTLHQATQMGLTPWMAFEMIKKGNERFQNRLKDNRNMFVRITNLESEVSPSILVFSSCDIKHHPDIIFDQSERELTHVPVMWEHFESSHMTLAEHFCSKQDIKLLVLLGSDKMYQQAERILKSNPLINNLLNSGSLGLIGCSYNESSGKVKYHYETFSLGTRWLCE
ncbi:MAG: hypothetical protein J0L69_13805 [Bacteroidetes bacterium]|nr:hypothetical protein [Bacteroidota bacterium]